MIVRVCPCGCDQLITGVRCDAATENQRRTNLDRAHGLHTAHWRRTRAAVRTRSHGRCELQLQGCTITATTTHLDPRLHGDHRNATIADCLDACHRCHGTIDQPRSAQPRGDGVDRQADRVVEHPANFQRVTQNGSVRSVDGAVHGASFGRVR
jgi:hypothetical protein